MIKYKVVGVMSGTSLDGLDLVLCDFKAGPKQWHYQAMASSTIPYTNAWRRRLTQAHLCSSAELLQLNVEYGSYIGRCVNDFLRARGIKRVDCIASHGHTVFHQPNSGFTYQLGDGLSIHTTSGLPVIFDFRSLDVRLGGQGAPLVPVGDHHLFGKYSVCLNIGGIANLSMQQNGKRVAFDICFANMGLNYLAGRLGKKYDRNGSLAARGKADLRLLEQLRSKYLRFKRSRPSLAREGFEELFLPVLQRSKLPVGDLLATFCESIAAEIAEAIPKGERKLQMLVTGGGALNGYLMSRIKHNAPLIEVVVPDVNIVKFKEAIVFAFLGVLRMRGEVNVFKTVTGASRDSSGGLMVGFTAK